VYAWDKSPLKGDGALIREIRASQYKVGVTRVVVELTRKAPYRVESGPQGLTVIVGDAASAGAPAPTAPKAAEAKPKDTPKAAATEATPKAAPVAKAPEAVKPEAKKAEPVVAMAKPAEMPKAIEAKAEMPKAIEAKAETPKATEAKAETPKATEAKAETPKATEAKVEAPKVAEAAKRAEAPKMAEAPKTPKVSEPLKPVDAAPAVRPAARVTPVGAPMPVGTVVAASTPILPVALTAVVVPAATTPVVSAPVPVVVGQAQPSAPRLLSMDFKDAEIVNLLRILAAESGRNIVAGDDVKGKVSVSLRNVTWEQALDTILEIRGLQKVERGGVIRIVSVEQLAKEREALVRVEDARTRAEIETRTKAAEAQLKEQELVARKLANELNEQETRARGPLREETIRLSYADPEEIAKTLQGILGIPPEGTAPIPTGAVPVPSVPSDPPTIPSGGTLNPALGRAPQAASPILGTPGQSGSPVMSVSQDVLAKGITIRAHKATNSIFIRHYQSDLERIKKLVREQLDVPLPQVKIEARMEILDRNSLEALGVQWGSTGAGRLGNATLVGTGFQSANNVIPGQVIPTVGGILLPDGATVRLANTPVSGFNPSNPNLALTLPVDLLTGLATGGNLVNLPFSALPNAVTQGGSPAGGFSFGIVGNRFNINLALEALATQGKTRTLARPEIVTVENSKAAMSLGEEIPYATVSSAGTQVQFKEAVLKLEVLPTVIRERVGNDDVTRVKMVVLVENNSRGQTISPAPGVSVPIINRRKAETQVLIKEGERLVIGGVSQSSQQDTVRKVPVLGDIPVIGRMFKQNEQFDTSRELVVFVTPSVIRHQGGPQAVGR